MLLLMTSKQCHKGFKIPWEVLELLERGICVLPHFVVTFCYNTSTWLFIVDCM